MMHNARDKGKASVKATKEQLGYAISLTKRLIDQVKQVVSGNRIIPDRIISFFDPEARPIKQGKLSKTAEFGYKARIDETENGFVNGYELNKENPSDDEMLVPAVKQQHKNRFDTVPNAVATDRGSGSKKSKKRTKIENQPWNKNLQRYRAAGEAKISLLKRKYGFNRSRYRGFSGS